MTSDRHHRDAARVLAHILGADAAERGQAYSESVEQIARALELAARYQDLVADLPVPIPSPTDSKAA